VGESPADMYAPHRSIHLQSMERHGTLRHFSTIRTSLRPSSTFQIQYVILFEYAHVATRSVWGTLTPLLLHSIRITGLSSKWHTWDSLPVAPCQSQPMPTASVRFRVQQVCKLQPLPACFEAARSQAVDGGNAHLHASACVQKASCVLRLKNRKRAQRASPCKFWISEIRGQVLAMFEAMIIFSVPSPRHRRQ